MLFISILGISCNNDLDSKSSQISPSISIDSLPIPFVHQIEGIGDKVYFSTSDQYQLGILDYSQKEVRVLLDSAITKGEKIKSFDISKDYLVARLDSRFLRVSLESNKIETFDYNMYFTIKEREFTFGSMGKFERLHIIDSSNVVLSIYSMEYSYWQSDFFKQPVLCRYNLVTGEQSPYDLKYPDEYSHNNFGSLVSVLTAHDKEHQKIFCAFQASDDLAILDYATNKVNWIDSPTMDESEFVSLPFDTTHKDDMNFVFDHLTWSGYYNNLLYSESTNQLFRILDESLPKRDKAGEYTSINNKKRTVQIFSPTLEFVGVETLNSNFLPKRAFTLEGDLFLFSPQRVKQRNSLIYSRLKFN
jgi:hypothetical protein